MKEALSFVFVFVMGVTLALTMRLLIPEASLGKRTVICLMWMVYGGLFAKLCLKD